MQLAFFLLGVAILLGCLLLVYRWHFAEAANSRRLAWRQKDEEPVAAAQQALLEKPLIDTLTQLGSIGGLPTRNKPTPPILAAYRRW